MRALFDVDVLIALLDPDNIGHVTATAWFPIILNTAGRPAQLPRMAQRE
jgi:hypothetical protein